MEAEIKTTCLHDRHCALGAQMSPFAGYDMPIEYEGLDAEHSAVRTSVGLFDVSHMGEVDVEGPQALEFVNHIFTGDVSTMHDGQCLYGMMTNEHGGVVDDLLVYRADANKFMLVINAANIDKDIAWISSHTTGFDVRITDRCADYGQLALQGPHAEATMRDVLGIDGADLGFYTFKTLPDGTIVSRTGYRCSALRTRLSRHSALRSRTSAVWRRAYRRHIASRSRTRYVCQTRQTERIYRM